MLKGFFKIKFKVGFHDTIFKQNIINMNLLIKMQWKLTLMDFGSFSKHAKNKCLVIYTLFDQKQKK